jgi:hypothetical protein
VTISNVGLNAQGNWLWYVRISNSNPVPTGSSPLAAELGFRETASTLIGAVNLSTGPADDFSTIIPGTPIFGWELPGTGPSNYPEGIQTNCASGCTVNLVDDDPNTVFSALRSINYSTVGPHDYIQIITKGPIATSANSPIALRKSSIQMLGAYDGKGRITEATSTTTAANYDTYAAQYYIVATPGDANLTGFVDLVDFGTILRHFGTGVTWQQGNFDGNGIGTTDLTDFNIFMASFGRPSGVQGTGPGPGAGASLGAGSAVPEPGGMALILFSLMTLGCRRR